MYLSIQILNIIFCLKTFNSVKIEEEFPFENYYLLSTDIPESLEKRDNTSCVNQCINLPFANNSYEVCFSIYDLSSNVLVTSDTKFIIHCNKSEKFYNPNQLNIKFVKGCACDKPCTSILTGYIDDNKLYGKVEIDSKVFYIEPVGKFPFLNITNPKMNAIIYEVHSSPHLLHKRDIKRGRLCSLLIVIDNSFLQAIAKNNTKLAIAIILHSLDLTNALFRATDFNQDGVPDNIGFKIKYVALESERTKMNKLPQYSKRTLNGLRYLYLFSRYKLLEGVCLGIAFTAQSFTRRALGLSYKGSYANRGICEGRSQKENKGGLNSLIITYRLENDIPVLQIISDLSLAHELGHSFGSDHDATKECMGYLMAPNIFDKIPRSNFLFSNCSKEKISETVEYKGRCFESSTDLYCENGLLKEDQECDCGFPFICPVILNKCLKISSKRFIVFNRASVFFSKTQKYLSLLIVLYSSLLVIIT